MRGEPRPLYWKWRTAWVLPALRRRLAEPTAVVAARALGLHVGGVERAGLGGGGRIIEGREEMTRDDAGVVRHGVGGGAGRIDEPRDGDVVVRGAAAVIVQDFEVVAFPFHEREPGRFLVRLRVPDFRSRAGCGDEGAADFVDRLAVVGNPKLGRVAGGEPEVVVAGGGRGEIAAQAFGGEVAVGGVVLEAVQGSVRAVGREIDRNVGDAGAGHAARPDFAGDGVAGIEDANVQDRTAEPEGVGRDERDLILAHRGRDAADHAGARVQAQSRRQRPAPGAEREGGGGLAELLAVTVKLKGWPTNPTALSALVMEGAAVPAASG